MLSNGATPQQPLQEEGVKKSSTAGRPVTRKRSDLVLDSIESNFNFKTHPNAEQTRVTTDESFLVSRVLHDQDKMLYGKGTAVSKRLRTSTPAYNYEAEVFRRRIQTPRMPMDSADGVFRVAKKAVFRTGEEPRIHIFRPRSEGADRDPLPSETEVYRRGQTSRNPIPHPPTEDTGGDSLGNKRGLVFSDDTSKILERKTLLYSEPFYRPTNGVPGRNDRIDPRRLISILGDPLPAYKRSNIAGNQGAFHTGKRVQVAADPWSNMIRKGHARGAHHRKARFRHHREGLLALEKESWDQDEHDIGQSIVRLCLTRNVLYGDKLIYPCFNSMQDNPKREVYQ